MRPSLAEIASPDGERLGIILPENAFADNRYAEPLAQRFQHLRRGQHAAGENVALDEIDFAAIGLEQAVLDGDGLNAGEAAGQQPVAQLREILWPELFADRLDHLDRGDPVVLLALVAVVLQPDLDLVGEAGVLDARLREIALLLADGQPDHPGAKSLGGIFGKAAPAASDL